MILTLLVKFLNCVVPTIKCHVDSIRHCCCLSCIFVRHVPHVRQPFNIVVYTGSYSTELYCRVFCLHSSRLKSQLRKREARAYSCWLYHWSNPHDGWLVSWLVPTQNVVG